jgi:hypothetical protein
MLQFAAWWRNACSTECRQCIHYAVIDKLIARVNDKEEQFALIINALEQLARRTGNEINAKIVQMLDANSVRAEAFKRKSWCETNNRRCFSKTIISFGSI